MNLRMDDRDSFIREKLVLSLSKDSWMVFGHSWRVPAAVTQSAAGEELHRRQTFVAERFR
jgi:hypothetical protein